MNGYDNLYFLFLAPAMILASIAQSLVKTRFSAGKKVQSKNNITGSEAARRILDNEGLRNVQIEKIDGYLSDHYDPTKKVLRLSTDVHDSASLASLGVAAHEAGHAIQDAKSYPLLRIRNAVVPIASFGSNISMLLIMAGFAMGAVGLIKLGIVAYSTIVFFQVVNLPVEFDASSRAKKILVSKGIIYENEEKTVSKVLSAAALTYVAATISAISTLLYYIVKLGQAKGGCCGQRKR